MLIKDLIKKLKKLDSPDTEIVVDVFRPMGEEMYKYLGISGNLQIEKLGGSYVLSCYEPKESKPTSNIEKPSYKEPWHFPKSDT
jgi:hypothetical protein